MRILVAGGGGFIGGWLVRRLLDEGHEIRAVDIKPLSSWWQIHEAAENVPDTDLREITRCHHVCAGVEHVYNLACDMGGMGFIESHKAACMISVLINMHLLLAARDTGVQRYFYSSSACVYAAGKQDRTDVVALKESDAYPAMAEDGYGWEKLFSERMCKHFMEDFKLECRVARFHNVYGPHGSWHDGREKAPAAICRKVARLKPRFAPEDVTLKQYVELWGDGSQVRSFMWIDDCIEGIRRIMDSDIDFPINLGSSESVTVDGLLDIVCNIAGIQPNRRYDITKPQGVRGRNSDNTLIKKELDWEPSTPLCEGLAKTYAWIEQKVKEENATL